MLLCFAAAWPFNIMKAYNSRTAAGTSLWFMLVIEIGYVLGILNKIVRDDINYVVYFYVLDIVLVAIGIFLYFRNRRIDALNREQASSE